MHKILVDLEEHNIRWAKMTRSHARSSIRWIHFQALIFGGLGLYFIVAGVLGWSSIWYLFTAVIYLIGVGFLYKWAYPRHIQAIWKSLRSEAEARVRLRKLHEEFDA